MGIGATNTVRGPGSKSMNCRCSARSGSAPSGAAELRVETFNLFNWVNYGFRRRASPPGHLGRITSSIGDQREIQLAFKLYF